MVHGSGVQLRSELQTFVYFAALHGIAVLAYDKRGVGQSGGSYPGEAAAPFTVDVLARDAQAAARFLAAQPEVDTSRVGLLGDSQAGWIMALAAAREPAVRWSVALAGPTIDVGRTDTWGDLAGKGDSPPEAPLAVLEARVRSQQPTGFDPRPFLAQLGIPMFWVFGDSDRNVPTTLCIESLQQLLPGHDYSWVVLHTTHTLLELPSGLNADILRSHAFAAGLYSSIEDWLRRHGLTAD
jgi:pimeloyl-ACP methyl ester carboxylesterase